jgi:hypothetical protein
MSVSDRFSMNNISNKRTVVRSLVAPFGRPGRLLAKENGVCYNYGNPDAMQYPSVVPSSATAAHFAS